MTPEELTQLFTEKYGEQIQKSATRKASRQWDTIKTELNSMFWGYENDTIKKLLECYIDKKEETPQFLIDSKIKDYTMLTTREILRQYIKDFEDSKLTINQKDEGE